MTRENVVITGVGVVSAVGIGQDSFFQALLNQRSGVCTLNKRTDGDAAPKSELGFEGIAVGAPILDFDPKQYVRPRKALKVMCREIQLAFASAHLAIQHADLTEALIDRNPITIPPERVGTVYGSEIFFNPPGELAESLRRCLGEDGDADFGQFGEAARKEVMPLWMLKYLPNMPACQIGISINAQGPNNSIILGDVSGPAALIEAQSYLQRGLADVVLAGATGTRISAARLNYRQDLAFPAIGDLSVESCSRPHDPESVGVVGGEGAASLVVETASSAQARGVEPLARVLAACSRFSPTEAMQFGERAVPPRGRHGRGATRAIRLVIDAALQQAAIDPDQVGLIISHALGDREVDAAERKALGDCGISAPMVAVSASVGHLGAGSGMLEVAAGVLAIHHKTIPPTRHQNVAADAFLLHTAKPLDQTNVICLSHTTEGSATAIVLSAANR